MTRWRMRAVWQAHGAPRFPERGVSIAVLRMHDGSHAYGKQTLRAIFRKLLAGLPTAPHPLSLKEFPEAVDRRAAEHHLESNAGGPDDEGRDDDKDVLEQDS